MRRLIAFALLLVLGLAFPVTAQTTLPNYIARDLVCRVESGVVVFRFNLENTGGAAQNTATIAARRADDGSTLATADVQPLASGGRTSVDLRFPSNLVSGTLRLNAAITFSAEDAGNRTQPIQVGSCRINIPAIAATSAPISPTQPSENAGWSFGFDLQPEWIAGGALALCCVVLLIGALIVLVARLLKRPAPAFPVWQPPYVPPAMLNPATQAGARAGWQDHASSDALPYPCLPFDHAARKVLLGMDGVKLRNWRFEAVRAVQYDMYGRINRTQVIASKRMIKRLNQQLAKSMPRPGKAPRSTKAIVKSLQPSAARLANRLLRSTDRTPSLPIALDLRLTGDHGTVRILFELYTCADGGWQLLDTWEPEMMLRGGLIAENFSYTFYGRTAGESKRDLRRRLREDIAQRLGQMIAQPQPPPPAPSNTGTSLPPEPPVPAGSTSPASPVQFDQPAPPPTQEIPRVPDAPSAPPEA